MQKNTLRIKMKNNFLKGISYILVLLFVLALGSCGSKKLFIKDGAIVKSKSEKEIFSDLLEAEIDYNTISTKGKIEFNGKEVSAIFKIVKNEILQVSIRPVLGIEMARIDITPDKILFLDRFNKQYTEITFQEIQSSTGLDLNYYNLQSILTNKIFIQGKENLYMDDFKLFTYSTMPEHYVLTFDKNEVATYEFFIDSANKIDEVKVSNPVSNAVFLWNYAEFMKDDNYVYPTELIANLSYGKKKVQAKINYNKLSINTEFQVDQSVPSKYTKRSLKEIISKIAKL